MFKKPEGMSEICVDLDDFEELNYFSNSEDVSLFDIWLRALTMYVYATCLTEEELVCLEKCLQWVF